ncbi:MAG: hypothetical protein ACKVJN_15680, partial [Woeseiales bacterium]
VETIDVVSEKGMLYLQQSGGGQTPLIPEDAAYNSLDFYTLNNGRKSPVNFRVDDDGQVSLIVGRYVYRKNI